VQDENAQLYADAQRLLAEEAALRARLTTLTDGSFRLLTSLKPESVVKEVLALAERVVAADAYAVWQREGDEWTVAGSRGLSDTFVSARLEYDRTRIPFDEPIIAVDWSGVEALSTRAEAYRAEGIVSMVGVPLAVRGEPSGSVVFYYRQRHQPSEGELRVAVALGHLAAAAIDNARLYAEAQRANRLKDEFLATLSHELRTPLNVIAGRARMLAGIEDAAQAREFAGIIDRNSAALSALVDDLLDVSRMTIGHIRLERQVVDIAAVVNGALQSVQSAAEAKGVTLEASVDPESRVIGDQMRLQQIAWNLLTNAVKFTPAAGRVTIAARLAGDTVTVTVRDSGQGISPEALPHLFDMFWQAEPLSARRQGGLGLGLSIVKKLAELHGGSVTAASDGPNTGATFAVMLPRARAQQVMPSA
jgi:signal transduction histidine kinase